MITPLLNQNDIYLYFDAIRQIHAKNVLDIGMTLKRCGAVSRQVADSAIDPSVFLCGICPDMEPLIPVYQIIYQEILTQEKLLKNESKIKEFDLAVLLKPAKEPFINDVFFTYLKQHAKRMLVDHMTARQLLPYFPKKEVRTIHLDSNLYYLIRNNRC